MMCCACLTDPCLVKQTGSFDVANVLMCLKRVCFGCIDKDKGYNKICGAI